MDQSVEADCICKTYRGGAVGVTGLTFRAAAGQVFGLLGPAGAGKTTVLKLIAGLLKPTAGVLRIDGHDCVAERAVARQMVGALLAPMGSGSSRRLWSKQVLLVDEPVLPLDEPGRPALGATLRALAHEENRTVILATRRLDVARQLCDWVALLKDGRLLDCRAASLLAVQPDGREWWEIRVKGHLAGLWSDWFAGFSLAPERDGTLLLSGLLPDQSALHGLLARIRDLGLPLLSLTSRPALDLTGTGLGAWTGQGDEMSKATLHGG